MGGNGLRPNQKLQLTCELRGPKHKAEVKEFLGELTRIASKYGGKVRKHPVGGKSARSR
jgi:hypothetical protein